MAMRVVNGDLLRTDAQYICHQVNCKGRMGSGVAKQIRAKYPEVYSAYIDLCNERRSKNSLSQIFGQTQFVRCHDGKTVVNMFAQNNYGYDSTRYTSYTAFQSCLFKIAETIPCGTTIAMPYKIGCGLGGGDWNSIYAMIHQTLGQKFDVELWRLV